MRKRIIQHLGWICLLVFYLNINCLGIHPFAAATQKVTSQFLDNRSKFLQIAEYLKTDSHDSLYMANNKFLFFRKYSSIDFKSWNWVKGTHENNDDIFVDNVKHVLFELGYSSIEKNKNGIYFIRQTRRNKYEQGVLFALNDAATKVDHNENPYDKHSRIETNWYYFNTVNIYHSTLF